MTGPATCELIGRWRIVEADLWDRDYLDRAEPACLPIGRDGWAEFAFGCLTAGGQIEASRTIVFFRWSGCDEGEEVCGGGSAELQEDGTIEMELSFDNGDNAILTGRRE